jgi:anti-sigma regulatory factor (Ser/Thr protein kinase)
MNDLSLELKNCQTETEKLCRCVEDLGETLGLAQKTVFAITLAIEEIFTNIVSYGFKDDHDHVIVVTLNREDGTLVIRIEDDGEPFNPENARKPDVNCPLEESKIGGLGIHLAKKMMDEFEYERRRNKNIITMKKYLLKE